MYERYCIDSSTPTLQKSIDLTPLLPSAGPTGGDGDACPAPTMSLTIWSPCNALRAIAAVGILGSNHMRCSESFPDPKPRESEIAEFIRLV